MSAKEFWEDDPQLFVSYRTFFINKQKRKNEELNYACWLQGLYIYDGMNKENARLQQTIFNGFQGFSSNPNFLNQDFGTYPKHPYNEHDDEKETQKEKKSKYIEYQEDLMVQGSLKQIYLDRMTK